MVARAPLVIGSNGLPQQLQTGDTLLGGGGGGSTIFTGNAVLDFGAYPGTDIASVVITGQTGIGANSYVNVKINAKSTADHSVDEHIIEDLDIIGGNIVPGTGFTIYMRTNTSNIVGQWSVSWLWS